MNSSSNLQLSTYPDECIRTWSQLSQTRPRTPYPVFLSLTRRFWGSCAKRAGVFADSQYSRPRDVISVTIVSESLASQPIRIRFSSEIYFILFVLCLCLVSYRCTEDVTTWKHHWPTQLCLLDHFLLLPWTKHMVYELLNIIPTAQEAHAYKQWTMCVDSLWLLSLRRPSEPTTYPHDNGYRVCESERGTACDWPITIQLYFYYPSQQ